MFEFKNVLNPNPGFARKKTRIFYTVGFTDEELAFFEIHFETACKIRRKF